jgi:hypothetical protein
MQTLNVKIQGVSPLLQHRFIGEPPEGMRNKPPQEQAELATYRDIKTGELYIPVENLTRALISGASYSKGKGRSSLQKEVAAAVFVSPARISLGTKKFETDSRSVVIPATKGRIMAHRPRIDEWSAGFVIEFDETLLRKEQIVKILSDTGSRVGLMDFRPERKGPYGRFEVLSAK